MTINTTESSGWEFWGQHYDASDRRLIAKPYDHCIMASEDSYGLHKLPHQQIKPSLSCLLYTAGLFSSGELVFSNVPRIAANHTRIIQQLIDHHVRPNIRISSFTVTNQKWVLKFGKQEDAVDVMVGLNGLKYRGKVLLVRINTEQHYQKPSTPPMKHVYEKLGLDKPNKERGEGFFEKELIWTKAEVIQIHTFKRELTSHLLGRVGGCAHLSSISEMESIPSHGLIRAALHIWPLGLLRLFKNDLRMTGKMISVIGEDSHASLIRKATAEGLPTTPVEDWEPMNPSHIRNESQLLEYTRSLLLQFGPQHLRVDLPIRMLTASIRPAFAFSTPLQLANRLCNKTSELIQYDDVLYCVSHISHRRFLLQTLRPALIAHSKRT